MLESFCRSSNNSDLCHSARVTSSDNIKGGANTLSLSSSLTLLDDSSSSNRPSQHERSTFNFWTSVSFRSPFFHHLFIPPRPTGPRNFKVRHLTLALSFATVFFHVSNSQYKGHLSGCH